MTVMSATTFSCRLARTTSRLFVWLDASVLKCASDDRSRVRILSAPAPTALSWRQVRRNGRPTARGCRFDRWRTCRQQAPGIRNIDAFQQRSRGCAAGVEADLDVPTRPWPCPRHPMVVSGQDVLLKGVDGIGRAGLIDILVAPGIAVSRTRKLRSSDGAPVDTIISASPGHAFHRDMLR
jgi:hypothetical protein